MCVCVYVFIPYISKISLQILQNFLVAHSNWKHKGYARQCSLTWPNLYTAKPPQLQMHVLITNKCCELIDKLSLLIY